MTPGPIETEARRDAAVVRVRTEIDVTVADPLRRAVAEAADRYGNVVLDLTGAPTLDSAGLGALVRAHKHARRRDAVLCLAAPSRYVITVLHTMKVDVLFPTFDDCDSALDWLRTAAAEPRDGVNARQPSRAMG